MFPETPRTTKKRDQSEEDYAIPATKFMSDILSDMKPLPPQFDAFARKEIPHSDSCYFPKENLALVRSETTPAINKLPDYNGTMSWIHKITKTLSYSSLSGDVIIIIDGSNVINTSDKNIELVVDYVLKLVLGAKKNRVIVIPCVDCYREQSSFISLFAKPFNTKSSEKNVSVEWQNMWVGRYADFPLILLTSTLSKQFHNCIIATISDDRDIITGTLTLSNVINIIAGGNTITLPRILSPLARNNKYEDFIRPLSKFNDVVKLLEDFNSERFYEFVKEKPELLKQVGKTLLAKLNELFRI